MVKEVYTFSGDTHWPYVDPWKATDVVFGGGGIPNQAPPTIRAIYIPGLPGAQWQIEGRTGRWIGRSLVTFRRERENSDLADRFVLNLVTGEVSNTRDDPEMVAGNEFETGNGHWATWLASQRRIAYDNRVLDTNCRSVRMSGDYLLTVKEENRFRSFWRGSRLAREHPYPADANEFRISNEGWISYGYNWETRVILPDGRIVTLTATPWRKESPAVLVHLPNGETWAWTSTDENEQRLVIGRPFGTGEPGETPCIVLEEFPANDLDVQYDASTDAFVVAGSVRTGHLSVRRVSRNEVRRPIQLFEEIEDTSGQELDLFEYFIPQSGTFPRSNPTPVHGHEYHVTYDGRNLHEMRFGEPDHWVRCITDTLDGKEVLILREDRSQHGEGTGDYIFTKGIWAYRFMRIGDRLRHDDNVLIQLDPRTCEDVPPRISYPYVTGPYKHFFRFNCGGDLGWQDVVIFLYDPGHLEDTYEFMYLAKGFGPFRFELWNQRTNELQHYTVFNEFWGRVVTETPGCWRREMLDWKADKKASMTIVEPKLTEFPKTVLTPFLYCRCGSPEHMWADWVEWVYRAEGTDDWLRQDGRRDPELDNDHTFRLPGPGRWEVGLRWSTGQTGSKRLVIVR